MLSGCFQLGEHVPDGVDCREVGGVKGNKRRHTGSVIPHAGPSQDTPNAIFQVGENKFATPRRERRNVVLHR